MTWTCDQLGLSVSWLKMQCIIQAPKKLFNVILQTTENSCNGIGPSSVINYLKNIRNLCRNEWEKIVWNFIATAAQQSSEMTAVPAMMKTAIKQLQAINKSSSP